MLPDDDHRHGMTRGFHAGCRCSGCSIAMRRYWKLMRVNAVRGETLRVPGLSVRRRVEALFRLGWTADEIAAEAGWSNRNDVIRLRSVKWVERKTFKVVAEVYERMCMSLPPCDGRYRTRQRNHAERNGWLPPLAWDNIDDPNETPRDWQYRPASRAETLTDLIEHGAGITEACRVLKVGREGLEKWCQRHGHNAEFRELLARETAVFTYVNQHSGGAA